MNRLVRHLAALLAAGALFASSNALAQKAPSQAAAQALFEEGRRLMQQGKYADACPKLAESQRLDPGAGTLLNLAACYEKNGQTASAWATYKEAISESEKSNRREWATRARQRSNALEPNLSKLIISVPASSRVDGLVVKRDGAEVTSAEWSVAIPVDPGGHVVEASAPGRKAWTGRAQVPARRETITVTVPQLEITPTADAPPTPAPTKTNMPTSPSDPATPAVLATPEAAPARAGSTQRTLGFVAGGVGVAGLAVGAVFGLQALSAKKDAEASPGCNDALTVCNRSGLETVDDAKGKATISTVGFVAGGALVVAGALLVITAPGARAQKAGGAPSRPWASIGGVGHGSGVTVGANF